MTMTKKQIKKITSILRETEVQMYRKLRLNSLGLRKSGFEPIRDSGDRILNYTANNFLQGEIALLYRNLEAIENALERIRVGSYGKCKGCYKSIDEKRLFALPWATLCVRCQQRSEGFKVSKSRCG